MKSLKEFRSQINEVLKASDPIEKWIDDFVHSKNPKFAGKSTKERIEMAKGAYYGAQKNESASISQNTESMTKMEEDHLVHVTDGSGYDDTPHPKDIEHIKTGAMHTGGQWHGHSDKGAFFKFKSKEDAEQFKRHVDKCPHKSCYADHVNEAVEYKGIGTDVVDKKKVLNPPIPLTQKKKEVKDFKEEAEELDELDKKTIGSYAKKATKDLKWQQTMRPFDTKRIQNREKGIDTAIDKLTKEEVEELDEGDSGLAAKAKKSGVSLSTLKTVYKRGVAAWNSGHRPGTTPQQWGMARVNSYITKGKGTYGGADKDLHEDARLDKKEYHKGMSDSTAKARVAHWKKADKLSDSNPKAYEPAPGDKTAKTTPSVHTKKYHAMYGEAKVYDPITKKMVSTKPIKVQAGGGATRNGVPVETGPSKYKQGLKQEAYEHGAIDRDAKVAVGHKAAVLAGSGLDSGKHGKVVGSSVERTGPHWHIKTDSGEIVKMHKHRVAKLKEDVEQIDELSKTTLQSYRDKAAKDVGRAYAIHQDPYKKTDKDDMRKLSNRVKGDERAEIGLKKEDAQIDEVSKATLVSYIDKASQDVHDKAMAAGSHHAGKSYKDFMANYAKSGKRQAGITKAAVKLAKEEVEQIEEATVASRKYDFGTMKTIHHGKSFSIPLHPEHHQPIAKLKHGESHSFKDETGAKWKATRDNDTVHFHGGSYGTQKTSVPHSSLQESRGHKVLATFFKNREVAQRAFQGNPAKDAEVAQGGGTPADQGIAAAKKDAEKLKKESVNPALMAILKKRQEAQKKKEEDKKKVNEAKAGVSAKAPSVATPKTTKSSTKGYVSAAIPGTKRVTRAIPDNNEVGGGEGNQIKEDQYAADYKIKYYVDPITGENKTRKIRPHRVNFANSKMRAEPAQADARGDYGSWKEEV